MPRLRSFDGTETLTADVARPELYRHLFSVIAQHETTIARGAGLSYPAASFGKDVLSIQMTRFDRILAFDDASGIVDVEPGISIGALARFLADRGRYLPAMPGYPTITVGGCIAFDVHGKSQFHAGNFKDWVVELELYHRDHGVLSCSRDKQSTVFDLTCGGAGLTGLITKARLKTTALPARNMEVATIAVQNLQEAAEVLRARSQEADCLYSWNDLNRRGSRFGKGVVYVERFTERQSAHRSPPTAASPDARWPLRVWIPRATQLVLGLYGALAAAGSPQVHAIERALFPILGKERYFSGFGPRGLRESQVVIPSPRWNEFTIGLEHLIAKHGVPITLGSLKLFRGASQYLRFVGEGVCLALDVPASPRASALFDDLDALTAEHAGLVNIGKDSRLSAETCEQIFPEYSAFKKELMQYDPARRCSSLLRERLAL